MEAQQNNSISSIKFLTKMHHDLVVNNMDNVLSLWISRAASVSLQFKQRAHQLDELGERRTRKEKKFFKTPLDPDVTDNIDSNNTRLQIRLLDDQRLLAWPSKVKVSRIQNINKM